MVGSGSTIRTETMNVCTLRSAAGEQTKHLMDFTRKEAHCRGAASHHCMVECILPGGNSTLYSRSPSQLLFYMRPKCWTMLKCSEGWGWTCALSIFPADHPLVLHQFPSHRLDRTLGVLALGQTSQQPLNAGFLPPTWFVKLKFSTSPAAILAPGDPFWQDVPFSWIPDSSLDLFMLGLISIPHENSPVVHTQCLLFWQVANSFLSFSPPPLH